MNEPCIKLELNEIELPSVNMLYGSNGGRRFIPNKFVKIGKSIQSQVKEQIDCQYVNQLLNNKHLIVKIYINSNWYNKDGSIKRKDLANKEKFLIDKVFDTFDLDDKLIFSLSMIKTISNKTPSVSIEISIDKEKEVRN